jgi:hypothetical protein
LASHPAIEVVAVCIALGAARTVAINKAAAILGSHGLRKDHNSEQHLDAINN